MVPPLSMACLSRTGEPVSLAARISPSAWRRSARAASITSEPWTIWTAPVSTQGPESVTVQSLRLACTCMVCWRSEDLPRAAPAQATAIRPRTSLAACGVIVEAHLGQELDALAGKIGLHPGTAHCSAGGGDGHDSLGRGPVLFRMHVELLGAEHGGPAGAHRAVGDDVAAQLDQGALLVDPAGPGPDFPAAAVLVWHQEQWGGQFQRARAGGLVQFRRPQRERFLAGAVQGDDLEVAQDVVRAQALAALGRRVRVVAAPGEPAAEQRAGEQGQDDPEPPVHPSQSSSSAATRPCACRIRSHSSRAAPSPPREGVTQCTWSRIQWCTLAGATAKPAIRSTVRSGRSSPMNATSSRARPSRVRISSTQATLSLTSTCGSAPSSRARLAATRLLR